MRYTVRAAALATGVTEGRLRTWERRYGIPKPGRSDTGRRLYDEDDLAMIRRMVALTDAGLAAAEAAEAVLSEAAGGVIGEVEEPAPEPALDPQAEALVAAARLFDEEAVEDALGRAARAHGWPQVLDAVVFPALRMAGDEWERGDLLPAHEHFLSEVVRRRLLVEVAASRVGPGAPTVILACAAGERHEFGLLGLWLALRQSGVRALYLGADVPRETLMAAIEQVRPRAVVLAAVLSSARPELALAARAVATARLAPRLFVAGRALEAEGGLDVPGVRLPSSVVAAGRLVADEVRAAAPAG